MQRYCQTIMLCTNLCLVTHLKKEALRNGQIYPFAWMSPFTNRTYYVSHRCPFTAFIFQRDTLEEGIDTGSVFTGVLGSITFWPCGLQFLSSPLGEVEQLPSGKIWHIPRLDTLPLLTITAHIFLAVFTSSRLESAFLKALGRGTFLLVSFSDC